MNAAQPGANSLSYHLQFDAGGGAKVAKQPGGHWEGCWVEASPF
jgi:hypothetical protein